MPIDNIIDNIYLEEPLEKDTTLFLDDCDDIVIDNEEVDESSTIDTSWVHDFSRLQHIYNNQQRELMDTITASFIYINKNNYIDKIVSEIINLEIEGFSEPRSGIEKPRSSRDVTDLRSVKSPEDDKKPS